MLESRDSAGPIRQAGWSSPVGACRRILGGARLGLGLLVCHATPAPAQSPTPDPDAWRPLAYSDLRTPTARAATYVDIWKDAIDANNRAYTARGDLRFAAGNAPASEAHFVIWSAKRSVVLSVLNTALGCTEKARDRDVDAVVKLCPMRVAIYDGLEVRTMDAGRACILEPGPGARLDPSVSAAYGAYDVPTRTVKIGMIVNHRAVDGCSFSVPLGRE